jgi:GNAT superfamily N-acetyltransferase
VSLKLRTGRLADIFRLQEIERSAAELFNGSNLIDTTAMAVVAMPDHIASIDAGLSIVAECDERACGFVIGEMHQGDAYLRELDVDLSFQKRGIGAALVEAFVGAAQARGAGAIFLTTFRTPPWNAPFYARHGFYEVAADAFLPWMSEIWREQAKFLDMNTRVFMRRDG